MEKENFNLQRFIISIILVGVTLIVGIYISANLETTLQDTETGNGTRINETLSALDNVTAQTFAVIVTYPTATCSLSLVSNVTDGTTISAGNYTQPTVCSIILEDDSGFISEDVNIDYSWTYSQSVNSNASDAAGDVVDALANGTAWISILVVVGFATIVLSMLTSGLASAGKVDETPYY